MRYLIVTELLEIHHRMIEQSGGASGLRDLGALESFVAQPRMTFDGKNSIRVDSDTFTDWLCA